MIERDSDDMVRGAHIIARTPALADPGQMDVHLMVTVARPVKAMLECTKVLLSPCPQTGLPTTSR
jgi:hypothetical protein